MAFNFFLTPYMLWLIMVVSYISVGRCVIEFFNSLICLFLQAKQGCLVFCDEALRHYRRIFIGWNPMRRNMQKNLGFFAVGKVMLCVGGGSGAAGTIGGEGGPLEGANYNLHQVKLAPERGELCEGKPLKWAYYRLSQVKRLLKGADYVHQKSLSLISN
jgi:hypothetical protein